ncbi:Dynamin [Gracilaria domingensis]|nr:Dynamin [Gracilaria domingensis]
MLYTSLKSIDIDPHLVFQSMSEALSCYDVAYNRTLGEKINAIAELGLVLAEESIACPGLEAIERKYLVTMGGVGCGKSSVLEDLAGIRFPRAENTCTRTPTVVHLQVDPDINKNTIAISRQEDFRNPKSCEDMEELEKELRKIALDVKQSGIPVKDEPVYTRYVRRTGPTMTLIDLPGISYFDPNGFDVHEATTSMIRKYAAHENMILLIVFRATEEFGRKAFALAKKYDEDSIRTIGVATRCDTVETDSATFLPQMRMEDPNPRLLHGFTAIRNRLRGEESLRIEDFEQVLSTHALLQQLDCTTTGLNALAKKVVHVQSNVVDEFISNTTERVISKVGNIEKELPTLRSKIQNKADEAALVEEKMNTTMRDIETIRSNIQEAQGELKGTSDRIEIIERGLKVLKDDTHEKKMTLPTVASEIEEADSSITDLKGRIETIGSNLANNASRIGNAESQLEAVANRIRALKRDILGIRSDRDIAWKPKLTSLLSKAAKIGTPMPMGSRFQNK